MAIFSTTKTQLTQHFFFVLAVFFVLYARISLNFCLILGFKST